MFVPSRNLDRRRLNAIPLFAKKKKSQSTKSGKIQVLLLSHVKGTGQAGDIVNVAPAFFENKLRRSNSARRISDDEVKQLAEEKAGADKALRDLSLDMKDIIQEMTICISKKTGPNGHLYGSVGHKKIMQELEQSLPSETPLFSDKQVKITSIKKGNGDKLEHDAIKEVGSYKATVELAKSISANLSIEIIGKE